VKLKAHQVDGFIARPDPAVSAVLVYGPDAGLVAERARKLGARVVEDLGDPFRVTELDAERLRSEPHLLVEESQALCLLGGRRLVRVRGAGDGTTAAMRALLALEDVAAMVVVEAGELGAGSTLRTLMERAKRAMALPCYHDSGRDLADLLRRELADHQLTAEPAALEYLVEHLGGDRGVTRCEIAKLALYVGDRADRRVRLADAAAVVGDSTALAIEDAVRATALGQAAATERALLRLLAEGVPPVRILRIASTFMLLLLRLRREVDRGASPDAAIAGARPPIHFRATDAVRAALLRWPPPRLVQAVLRLQEAELAAKRTGAPSALICRHVLAELAGQDAGGRP
jgi:DNA polymerase-3 subunit delta